MKNGKALDPANSTATLSFSRTSNAHNTALDTLFKPKLACFPARYALLDYNPPVETDSVPTAQSVEGEAASHSRVRYPPLTQRRRLNSSQILQDGTAAINVNPSLSPQVVNTARQLDDHTAVLELFHRARIEWKWPEHEILHPVPCRCPPCRFSHSTPSA